MEIIVQGFALRSKIAKARRNGLTCAYVDEPIKRIFYYNDTCEL